MDESFRRRGHRSCEANRGFRSFGALLLRYAFELVGSKQKLGGGEGPSTRRFCHLESGSVPKGDKGGSHLFRSILRALSSCFASGASVRIYVANDGYGSKTRANTFLRASFFNDEPSCSFRESNRGRRNIFPRLVSTRRFHET